jgi:hypothetical protein
MAGASKEESMGTVLRPLITGIYRWHAPLAILVIWEVIRCVGKKMVQIVKPGIELMKELTEE